MASEGDMNPTPHRRVVFGKGSNTQNKATVDMDTSQVTLLTCFYVQQYYNPSHQEIIAEKESTDARELSSERIVFGSQLLI